MLQVAKTEVVKHIPSSAIHVEHAGKIGRPKKLNVARFLRICRWIETGKTNTAACKIEQIEYATWRFHCQKKRRWQWRYELANRIRDDYLRDFHLANVVSHAKKHWMASAWLLERKFPHLYALKSVIRSEGNAEKADVTVNVMTEERLLEMAKIIRTVHAKIEAMPKLTNFGTRNESPLSE